MSKLGKLGIAKILRALRFSLRLEMSVNLSDVLPADVLESAWKTVNLQETLMSISEESFASAVDLIKGLPFIQTPDGVKTLTNNLLLAVRYRPDHMRLIARLFQALVGLAGPENALLDLKTFLLAIPSKISEERWRLAVINECLYLGLFTEQEVFDAIKRVFERFPLLPNRPYWKNNSKYHYLFFIWFAPLIEKMDRAMFDDIWQRFRMSFEKHEIPSTYSEYMNTFEEMRADDWKIYRYMTRNTYREGSLASILRNDDLEKLKEIVEQPGFDVNTRIASNQFESMTYLLRNPTLIQFCAVFASVKCFKYLVEKGADLELRDSLKRILLNFAIAGGHPEIIKVAVDSVNDFVVATRVSAEFHRFELFRWFLTTKHTDLKANDIENGSIFHGIAAANHIRMILFCIEQGCDINLKDADGVCFLLIGHHSTVLSKTGQWSL